MPIFHESKKQKKEREKKYSFSSSKKEILLKAVAPPSYLDCLRYQVFGTSIFF